MSVINSRQASWTKRRCQRSLSRYVQSPALLRCHLNIALPNMYTEVFLRAVWGEGRGRRKGEKVVRYASYSTSLMSYCIVLESGNSIDVQLPQCGTGCGAFFLTESHFYQNFLPRARRHSPSYARLNVFCIMLIYCDSGNNSELTCAHHP